ncbi:MAG: Crp/Fnr family transcriptional regulator [Campylobacteraceae bacterium]|nr:Crp/Fnr family transcriptional regulator [Campylobacteraceae bacterium]
MELKKLFLFEDMSENLLDEIKKISSVVKLNKGNILFYEGDDPKYLHILAKGTLKLYKVTSSDKELIIKFFHENELIAEFANFENISYPATSEALTSCEVLKIDFEEFKKIMQTNVNITMKIQASLIKKIKTLENIISTHLILDTKQKVAKYIVEHNVDFFKTKNILIAQMLNMTPETLSRTLKVFKDNNLINISKKEINEEILKTYYM